MPSIVRNTREVMVAMRDKNVIYCTMLKDVLNTGTDKTQIQRHTHNTSTDGKQAESCDHVSDTR